MSLLIIGHPDPDPNPGVDRMSSVSVSCNDCVCPEEFSLGLCVPAEVLLHLLFEYFMENRSV